MKNTPYAVFVVIPLCLVPISYNTKATAEEFPVLSQYGDWGVFADGDECWVSSAPIVSTDTQFPGSDNRARLLVTYRTDGRPSEVSFVGRFSFEAGQEIHAAFGADRIRFFDDGEGAWPEGAGADEKMQHEMAKGTQVVLHVWSPDRSETVDVFSLLGFQAAAREAAMRCGQ